MRIALICAALVVAAGTTPAVASETAETQHSVSAAKCYVPQLIAHRGGGGVGKNPYYNENSWPAFQKSVQLGVKTLETDVRFTSDNVAVIMHDDDIARTTNGTGLVSASTYDQIKDVELDNGGGKIPLFSELLTFAKDNNVGLWPEYKPEIPNQTWIDLYAQMMKDSGTQVVVPSFLKPELLQFKTLLPGYQQIWFHDPLDGFSVKPTDVPEGAYAGLINVVLIGNPSVAETMSKAGITVYAWYNIATGGDNPTGWRDMSKFKPAGIITDYPEQYQQWAASTGYCQPPKAKCVKPPKKLATDSTVVLLRKTCKTSAGNEVKVALKAKKSAGKLKKGKNGKVSVVTGTKGKVTVTYSAPETPYAAAYKKSKKYTL